MGTNYYLFKKVDWTPNIAPTVGCLNDELWQVKTLANGFIWYNTYYSTAEELSANFYQVLHIGKASCGWHFALAVYPQNNIQTLDDWKALFYTKGNIIKDENGEIISPDVMYLIITERTKFGWREQDRDKHEQEELEAHKEFYKNYCMGCFCPQTYDELLNNNHAIRGKNGLWAHKPDSCTINTQGPYDYILVYDNYGAFS